MDISREYSEKMDLIKERLNDFSKVSIDDMFYEACFCILTPQSSAKACWNAVLKLKENDFKNTDFNPINFLNNKIRFYVNKNKYLLELKEKWQLIFNRLKEIKDSRELREFLVKNIKGFGMKESSHYLRNIGHKNLAILDRHILKNLYNLNVINEIPKTLTKKKYLEIEQKFMDFSKKVKIQMDELDLLFWSRETEEIFK